MVAESDRLSRRLGWWNVSIGVILVMAFLYLSWLNGFHGFRGIVAVVLIAPALVILGSGCHQLSRARVGRSDG